MKDATTIYYRSDYNGGIYPAPLANVKAVKSYDGGYRTKKKRGR